MFSIEILNNNLILEFVAKSTLVLAIAYALYNLFKKNAPSFRYIILITAIYTVFFLPLFLYAELTYDLEVDAPILNEIIVDDALKPAASQFAETESLKSAEPVQTEPIKSNPENTKKSESTFWNFINSLSANDAILLMWFIPFSIIITRFLIAYISIIIVAARAKKISSQEQKIQMIDLCDEIGLNRYVKLLISKDSITPMTWGIFQPFVLLPKEAEEWSDERLRYVLLHELAHIKRKDFVSNIVIQIVTAVLWFNPLAWFIQKQLLNDREYACDDHVVENGTKASEYADHLLDIAKSIQKNHSSLTSTMCMAKPSQLEGRLMALLKNKSKSMNAGEKILKLSITLIIMLPVIFINPIKASEPMESDRNFAKSAVTENLKHDAVMNRKADSKKRNDFKQEKRNWKERSNKKTENRRDYNQSYAIANSNGSLSISNNGNKLSMTTSEISNELSKNKAVKDFLSKNNNNVNQKLSKNYRQYLKQHIGDSLKLDDYIKMKRYGVTSEYVNDLIDLGFKNLAVDDVIKFSKYGLSIPYIKKIKTLELKSLRHEDYVAFAKYGVSLDLVYSLKQLDENVTIDEIIRASKYGLSKSFVKEIHESGYKNLSINDLIHMAKYGVSKKLIRSLKESNFKNLKANDITNAAKYGLDPKLIKEIHAAGYKHISLSKIIKMAKYGVSSRLIRALKDEGYKKIDANDIIDAAKYGLNASYVREMNKQYGKRISLHYLIKFSKYGVRPSMIKSLRKKGYKSIDEEDLIHAAKHGLSSDLLEDLEEIGVDVKGDIRLAINLSKYGIDKKLIKKLIKKNILKATDIESIINISKHGINEYAVDAATELLDDIASDIDVDDIIDIGRHGISPNKIKELKEMGFKDLDIHDIKKASNFGLNKDLIDKCKKYGLADLEFDECIKIAMHRPDFRMIPILKEMGIKEIEADEFVRLGIAGVNKRFLNDLKKVKPEDGWTIERIVKVKHSGLDLDYIKEMKEKFDKKN